MPGSVAVVAVAAEVLEAVDMDEAVEAAAEDVDPSEHATTVTNPAINRRIAQKVPAAVFATTVEMLAISPVIVSRATIEEAEVMIAGVTSAVK